MVGSLAGELAGKVALVSGASRGIGAAVAKALGEAGAAVAVNYARAEDYDDARRVARAVDDAGGTAIAVCADVLSEPDVDALVAKVVERFGAIDVVVNNAGVILRKRTTEMATAEFDYVIGVNLRGTFLVGRAALRVMLEGSARAGSNRIINVASDLGYLGRAEFAAYAASKAGVLALTRSWAREYAPAVLVNAVVPGPIETAMLSPEVLGADCREDELNIPLRRFGQPEDVAKAVVFLAGDGGRFMTGQTISPNGGSVMV